MINKIIKNVVCLLSAFFLMFSTNSLLADNYPSKPITMVIPYGPGGLADVSARILAGTLPTHIGQTILAINKAGAAGVIASTFVKGSKPDGYTLLLARVGSQMGVPAMNKTIPYKWDDFTIIGMLETNPFVLVVPSSSDINNFKEFEKKIKSGTPMTYGSTGVGTLLHIATAVMADTMGAKKGSLTHVPFKGGGKASAALMGGKVDFMWQGLSGVVNGIKAGKLRALAVATPKRQPLLPSIPTGTELGYANMEQIVGWSAVYGPPNMPDAVVKVIADALEKNKSDKTWIKMNKAMGNVIDVRSPAATKAFVGKQYKVYDATLKKMGMRITK